MLEVQNTETKIELSHNDVINNISSDKNYEVNQINDSE